METIIKKNLNNSDETQTFEHIKIDSVTVDGIKIQRVTAEPGWQWSKDLMPIVGGDSCQKHHILLVISGKMFAKMNNGTEQEFGPGDLAVIPPGHDGWNAGEEPVVWLEIPH